MIKRDAAKVLKKLARGFFVVAITGPRQSGKTTLAKAVFPDKPYVSLEDPDNYNFAIKDPRGFLGRYPDGAILDEVQRTPLLFSYIQGIVDEKNVTGLFVLTGSQQFGLVSKITQSLAGRVGMLSLLPFSLKELGVSKYFSNNLDELMFKGFYPPIYDRDYDPNSWYASYVATYIERDVRQIIEIKELSTFERFLRLLAARSGQLLNFANLANDAGISLNTAKAWISALEASYIIYLLTPHFSNIGKRLVKTPKIYFYDTGLTVWLLGIASPAQLSIHSMRGPLFESFILAELMKSRFNEGLRSNLFFWRDNTGNEVDVIIERPDSLIPIEIKSGQTISRDYFAYLGKWVELMGEKSGQPYVVYGGSERVTKTEGVEIISWEKLEIIERQNKTI